MNDSKQLLMTSGLGANGFLEGDLALQGIPQKYAQFRDCFLCGPRGNQMYDAVVQVAIDTEWYPHGDRNCILCYQYAAVFEDRAVNRIVYMRPGERLTLPDLIERALASLHGGEVPTDFRSKYPRVLVVLIAHNFVAEWSALKDRDEKYIVDRLKPIRKCPVTGIDPIEFFSPVLGNVFVHVYDTMLLAPVGFQSLDKLASLLVDESLNGDEDEIEIAGKIEISQFYKENMNVFLADDPEGFEKYALRDTELTLKLFVYLQESLNNLAYGKIKRVFKTLASAAVKGFQVKHPKFKKYRQALQEDAFKDAYRLIMRSYHGGRNEGFLIGDSRD